MSSKSKPDTRIPNPSGTYLIYQFMVRNGDFAYPLEVRDSLLERIPQATLEELSDCQLRMTGIRADWDYAVEKNNRRILNMGNLYLRRDGSGLLTAYSNTHSYEGLRVQLAQCTIHSQSRKRLDDEPEPLAMTSLCATAERLFSQQRSEKLLPMELSLEANIGAVRQRVYVSIERGKGFRVLF